MLKVKKIKSLKPRIKEIRTVSKENNVESKEESSLEEVVKRDEIEEAAMAKIDLSDETRTERRAPILRVINPSIRLIASDPVNTTRENEDDREETDNSKEIYSNLRKRPATDEEERRRRYQTSEIAITGFGPFEATPAQQEVTFKEETSLRAENQRFAEERVTHEFSSENREYKHLEEQISEVKEPGRKKRADLM